jgi:hypothetical protein
MNDKAITFVALVATAQAVLAGYQPELVWHVALAFIVAAIVELLRSQP